MIPLPSQPAARASILDWATQAQRTLRASRPICGTGIRLNETPNGTIISTIDTAASGRPALIQMPLDQLCPSPTDILIGILTDAIDTFTAALPTAAAIAAALGELLSQCLGSVGDIAGAIAGALASGLTQVLQSIFQNTFQSLGSGGTTTPPSTPDPGISISGLLSGIVGTAPTAAAIISKITTLFQSALATLDTIATLIDNAWQQYSGVGDNIRDWFLAHHINPNPGDQITTEEIGIVYTLHPLDKDNLPSTNLCFRLHFDPGSAPGGTASWVAITPYPVPDFKEIGNLLSSLLTGIIRTLLNTAAAIAGAAATLITGALSLLASAIGGVGDGLLNGTLTGITAGMATLPPAFQAWLATLPTYPVISAGGTLTTLKVLEAIDTGTQLFSYPELIGADGNAHTVGVLGDIAYPISTSHNIVYIGSDGQTWTVPSLFTSTQIPHQTERANHNFIDPNGIPWTGDIIVYTGTLQQQNSLVEAIKISGGGTGMFTEIQYIAPSQPVTGADITLNLGRVEVTGCLDGTSTTKTLLEEIEETA